MSWAGEEGAKGEIGARGGVRSYETHFAECIECRWRGPLRYTRSQAQWDMHGHDELRRETHDERERRARSAGTPDR